jgi:hypothetical protein
MTERKEFNDERAAMANDIRDEQTYLASCRERLSEYDVPRWDRLQRVIDYFDRAASPQATATQPAQTSPYLPCPICKGVEGCDHTVPERARAAQTERALTVARETLEHVRVFLRNGIELGYIAMPTIKCDPALQVPMKVDEALSLLTAAQPASGGDHA